MGTEVVEVKVIWQKLEQNEKVLEKPDRDFGYVLFVPSFNNNRSAELISKMKETNEAWHSYWSQEYLQELLFPLGA